MSQDSRLKTADQELVKFQGIVGVKSGTVLIVSGFVGFIESDYVLQRDAMILSLRWTLANL